MRLIVALVSGMTLLALMVVFAVSLSAEDSAAQDEATPQSSRKSNGPLKTTLDKSNKIRGFLDRPGKLPVKFQGEVQEPSENELRVNARLAVTKVEAGNLTINAKRNLRTEMVSQGAGGKRITVKQKQALTALCTEFEKSLGPVGAKLPPEKDLLVRSTCFFAEAPAGIRLKTETVPKTSVSQERSGSEETLPNEELGVEFVNVSYSSADHGDGHTVLNEEACAEAETGNFAALAYCRKRDNDGIRYLSCSLRTHRLAHDTKYGHCFRNYTRWTGPCTRRCIGRCGGGCGGQQPTYPYRTGVYSRDCAEHDRCYYHHPNSPGFAKWDRDCGDEWNDAQDDFAYGKFNCWGC